MRSDKRLKLLRKNDLTRVGIFGGTFDPVHYGHLICAEQLREGLDLDIVIFVPCSKPPHKTGYRPAPGSHRMHMVQLALRNHDGFATSDFEVRKGGISYTIDTVRYFRRKLGSEVELWLLMGMDTYADIPSWKEPRGLAKECFFGVAARPGFRRKYVRVVPRRRTRFVDITAVDISSSDIRERLSRGQSVRFLIPGAVERYIIGNATYRLGAPAR